MAGILKVVIALSLSVGKIQVSAYAAGTTTLRYFYDDAGQLFRILDTTGTLVEYVYDPVGNMSAINRSTINPSSLSILNLTPIITGLGQTITIYGQNFSPNVAGNIVMVNGVAATVISASPTALVVRLGTGTTSGPVSVTVNGVTATSGSLQLIVTLPNITSVTPDGAAVNKLTTVTVVGSRLTGATFELQGGGTISNAIVTDDSHATMQILGNTPGEYPIVATNSSGSSDSIVSPSNRFTVIGHGGVYYSMTLVNQAWIPGNIPSSGNLTVTGAFSPGVSVVNQAWIPANIPSAGNLGFAAGLLVSVNNTAPAAMSALPLGLKGKMIAAGASTAPVDLSSVNDGDALFAGQTVRFRVHPPDSAYSSAEFVVNGAPLQIHAPFEVLLTAPANVSAFDLQAVMYSGGGQVWRTPIKYVQILPDPGRMWNGRALHSDGSPASPASIAVRANGLTAEYFLADRSFSSWSDLDRAPDKRGFVSAINQPNPASVFGPDPFGTGFTADYAARFRGEVLVSAAGEHRFFLNACTGCRLMIDGNALIDTPIAQLSPESEVSVTLKSGWHAIEVDSYHSGSNRSLQLSWQPPDSDREVIRPEALGTGIGPPAETNGYGSFRLGPLPRILNPLDADSVPTDKQIHVVLDSNISEERAQQ